MKHFVRRLVRAAVMAAFAAASVATSAAAQTTTPVGAAGAAAWREDLAQLRHFLISEHGDVYHSLSERDLDAMVTALDAEIPDLARHQIVVEFARIAAAIGDGHTSVHLFFDADVGFHRLPLRLGWFEEGVFIEAVDRDAGVPAGSRLVAIGGVPIEEAIQRVASLISRDNDIWIRVMAPILLSSPEVLHAVGLSDDPGSASLTVDDGRRHEVRLRALPGPYTVSYGRGFVAETPPSWSDARRADDGSGPVADRHPGRAYWFELLPEQRILYIQYNMVNDAPGEPGVHEFFQQALHTMDESAVDRVVLDIRQNSGGEGALNTQVVRWLIQRPELQSPGSLIVLIGRRTFSAAQLLAQLLDLWTPAVFVGEPTGSSPRFWGDHRMIELKNSRIDVSVAPTWHQPGGPYDRRAFLPPLLAFEPRFDDYRANRDPAMDAIVNWDDQELDIGPLLADDVAAGDTAAAAAIVRAWDASPVHRYRPATGELNRAAYQRLREQGAEAALPLFRLNVDAHPDYANGWDSLGEVLLALGRHEEGMAAYQRAYALDPGVGNAAAVLGLDADAGEGLLDEYVGAYRVGAAETMTISRFDHDDTPLYLFTDFTVGWRGTLSPERGDTMRVTLRLGEKRWPGPRLVLSHDEAGRRALILLSDGHTARHGSLLPLRVEPVEFRNDTVTLSGEIVLPPGPGPHPGIVFVHGSGPATRNDYREWSRYFAANGIATLVYDKRGAGHSSGDYRRADFTDLAGDAAAAVERLRAHPSVDAERVGLSGGSQGAWVSPIAEGMVDDLAFLVLTGGGPITPAEQEIYRRARVVEDAGYDSSTVETARAAVTTYFDYLGSGGKDADLARAVHELWARHGNAPWFELLDMPTKDPTIGEWPEGRKRFASELFYDPAPSVRAVRTPLLAILGAEDQGFPTPRVVSAYETAVDPSLLKVLVLPGVDHGFFVTDDAVHGRHQSPQLFADMLDWIREEVAK